MILVRERGSGLPRVLLIATVLVVAANLRPAISAVGPLLEQIRADTGLSPSLLGLLGAIPVISFGVVSPFVHLFSSRWGLERSIFAALLLLKVRLTVGLMPPGRDEHGAKQLLPASHFNDFSQFREATTARAPAQPSELVG